MPCRVLFPCFLSSGSSEPPVDQPRIGVLIFIRSFLMRCLAVSFELSLIFGRIFCPCGFCSLSLASFLMILSCLLTDFLGGGCPLVSVISFSFLLLTLLQFSRFYSLSFPLIWWIWVTSCLISFFFGGGRGRLFCGITYFVFVSFTYITSIFSSLSSFFPYKDLFHNSKVSFAFFSLGFSSGISCFFFVSCFCLLSTVLCKLTFFTLCHDKYFRVLFWYQLFPWRILFLCIVSSHTWA